MTSSKLETFLRRHFQFKEIGWAEIGEKFTRYALWRTKWFNIYLHQLNAPNWHPECHDHPWGFVAILLRRGYIERVSVPWTDPYRPRPKWESGFKNCRRYPGQILFRPATFVHNVITPFGTSWSLVITTAKSRDWGFKPCEHPAVKPIPYKEYIAINSEERMA